MGASMLKFSTIAATGKTSASPHISDTWSTRVGFGLYRSQLLFLCKCLFILLTLWIDITSFITSFYIVHSFTSQKGICCCYFCPCQYWIAKRIAEHFWNIPPECCPNSLPCFRYVKNYLVIVSFGNRFKVKLCSRFL